MNHKKNRLMLSAFVDHELDESQMKSMRDHIDRCALCQKELQELQAIRAGIRETATLALPGNFIFSVQRSIRREEQESVVWLGPEQFARNIVVGLCIVVLALVTFGSFLRTPPPLREDRYFTQEISDSAAHAVLGSQRELSKEDVMIAALSK
jgi:hypothetical protein